MEEDQCFGKKCGEKCNMAPPMGSGICSGGEKGNCVKKKWNCSCQGCKDCGLKCGEQCLLGETNGWCNSNNTCGFSKEHLDCDDKGEKSYINDSNNNFNLYRKWYKAAAILFTPIFFS